MLILDSIFNQNSVFGQLRSLVAMQGLTEYGTSGAPLARHVESPTPSPGEPLFSPGEMLVCTNISDSSPPPSNEPAYAADESTAQRKRQPRPFYEVEPESIYDIMHNNAGTSLFIRPIAWTDIHATALNVTWKDLPRIDRPVPNSSPRPDSDSGRRLSKAANAIRKELNCIFAPGAPLPFYSIFPIREVMSTLFPSSVFSTSRGLAGPEMHMWFAGKAYRDAVRVQCLWTWPFPKRQFEADDEDAQQEEFEGKTKALLESFKTESTQPASSFDGASESKVHDPKCGKAMLAYIGRKQLTAIRSNLYRVVPGPGRTVNEPVSRLQARRCKMLIPANLDHDPHFIGILIAMAQHHIYPHYTPEHFNRGGIARVALQGEPEFRDVTVRILTNDNDTADFIVYTATISADYLRRLHFPTQSVVSPSPDGTVTPPGLDIEVTRVSAWPVLGLKERLGQALGEELVGDIDIENPELYEEKSAPGSPVDREAKRRRNEGTLGLFNGSFDENLPNTRLGGKRRRLGENGGPVGLVI